MASERSDAFNDLRSEPAYTIAEAARYLKVASATLRSWVIGRPYPRTDGVGHFLPLIHPPSRNPPLLSFANLIEAHVVFSRECFGPDVPASLTTVELQQLVEGMRFIETALASPIDKQAMADDLASLRRTFGKSVVAARALPAGYRIAAEDLAFKKPGTGIPASRYQSVIGATTKRTIAADTLLSEDDFE